ncbi:MAG: glutamate--tRNA ligase [Oscillospiraceae bacterium]|nr:glutamate--tRNA ligase [Oscillospiraceae bacterium]
MTSYNELAELMFPDVKLTPEHFENIYPPRQSKEGARITRIAPSPTGYLHLGVLFTAMINRITAKSTDGVFYFRLEDTDKKREVEGGAEDILRGLNAYGIHPDEGLVAPDEIIGNYGPYRQSERAEIYHVYAKSLVSRGLAYPCFCSEEGRQEARGEQERQKVRTGYYGEFALCRRLTPEQASERINQGEPYVVRLHSNGSEQNRIVFDDLIKGKIEMPENDEDLVLLKSDGIPTYHFAHAIDDHLMRTTHVIRGDEWISSVPKHIQLFKTLGFKPPKYAHVSPIMKDDGGGKRKLSKRKDPEAAVHYYAEQGYPADSVMEYLMTIASSDFEDWRRRNPDTPRGEFPFNLKKMSVSGALFDIDKLNDVSKTVISGMDAEQVAQSVLEWAKEYAPDFYILLNRDYEYTKGIFSVDRGGTKPRKDIAKWSDTPDYTAYFFDETFEITAGLPENVSLRDAEEILSKYAWVYNPEQDKQQWFETIKSICPALGFCPEVKEYKKNPEGYKGHAGDISTVIRIAVTGRQNTPDLCGIMRLLGKERVLQRLEIFGHN